MANVSVTQASFTAGELSPRLMARSDVQKYMQGLELCENFVVLPFGGVTRRSGSRFIGLSRDNARPYFIPFRFSKTDCAVIVATPGYFQFIRDRGELMNGENRYEIASPYTREQLPDLKWAQSGNVLYLTHPQHPVRRLMRYGATDWRLELVSFRDGPYQDANSDSSHTLQLGATSGVTSLTSNKAIFDANRDIGRLVRIGPINNWGWGTITAVSSSTSATIAISDSPGNIEPRWEWKLGAFYIGNYPSVACFYEERLWLANTPAQPQTLWGSRTNDFTNFAPTTMTSSTAVEETVLADSGLTYTLASDDLLDIKFLVPSRRLTLLTDSAEFTATGGSTAITPTNVMIQPATKRGCSRVKPVVVDSSVFFWQKGDWQDGSAVKLREFGYVFSSDSFVAEEVSIFSEHLPKPGIVSMAHQQSPNGIIWAVKEDGTMLGITVNKQQQVLAFHSHSTEGSYVDVCSVPGRRADDVYVVVYRNGKYMLEVFADEYEVGDEMQFMDSFLDGEFDEPVSVLTGLEHLAGDEVVVTVDNGIHRNYVVSSEGTIQLLDASQNPLYVTNARVGLHYESVIKTVPYPVGQNDGSADSKTGRIHRIGIHQYQGLGLMYGSELSDMKYYIYRTTATPMGQPPELYTGIGWEPLPQGYSLQRSLYLKTEQPYPLTILAVTPWLAVNN